MEDLVPLVFFLVIVAVNAFKFFIEKGGKSKQASVTSSPQHPNEKHPMRPSSSIEEFFEQIAQQIAPQPREVPDWPEAQERPDYMQEMEAFALEQDREREKERAADTLFMTDPILPSSRKTEPPDKVQHPTHPTYAGGLGSHGLRIAGMNAFVQSGAVGRNDFRINGKKNLKKAMLAHVVFSPPRALDLSSNNTLPRQA